MSETRNTSRDFGRVAVLMGGDSAEREISLLGGRAVLQALREQGVDAIAIDPGPDLVQALEREGIDRVFIMLHGRVGEDGTVQGILDYLGLPYTGSGVLACALAMDKVRCKQIWQAAGLPTPPFAVLRSDTDWGGVIEALGEVFVKPVREGSSIGIGRAPDAEQLREAWARARAFDDQVVAERLVDGPEFSVSILGDQVLPVIGLKSAKGFYDFHAKYESEDTQYVCPAPLDPDQTRAIQNLALEAYRAIGCSGWGRVDVMQDGAGDFWLLEVNTIPGMTSHSLVPIAARAVGLDFGALVLEILAGARHGRRREEEPRHDG